jgi:hypothetical protein
MKKEAIFFWGTIILCICTFVFRNFLPSYSFDLIGTLCALFGMYLLSKESVYFWNFSILSNFYWLLLTFSDNHLMIASYQLCNILLSFFGLIKWVYSERLPKYYDFLGKIFSIAVICIAYFKTKFDGLTAVAEFFAAMFFVIGIFTAAKKHISNWYFWIIGCCFNIIFTYMVGYTFQFVLQFIFMIVYFKGIYNWKLQRNIESPKNNLKTAS